MTDQIAFDNTSFDELKQHGASQVAACTDIWNQVRVNLEALVAQGMVDEQIGAALDARNEEFMARAARFRDDHEKTHNAMTRAQDIGNEGGAGMVRALQ
ncbi:hypothetical protein [Streptomyces spiramenti]|uniref:WXG100 family type VII secretion target n=1 Tax=Streptomyces spiramenti TaxID=2720606 RepID=A0ABX1ALT7_9ACTN|nr:hypothetical protein [Streptomyces spiramenti]NJP68077.1 hypothetical protein [Streptomyces spiramenti]